MWWKWFPWKFILKQVAQAQGFLDPIMVLSRFNQFAQPSEVWAPVELMRAGAVFHARGLINSQVIQHNLDWVWPYWVERQFDPTDRSFLPRAFSLTHVNLTHRNWTAIGLPGSNELPIVDSRGLVTPFFDSWSIDSWVVLHDGTQLIPSRLSQAEQSLSFDNNLKVITKCSVEKISLKTTAEVLLQNGIPYCQILVDAKLPSKGLLIVALRPYNPEGISFIHEIFLLKSYMGWRTDKDRRIYLDKKPDYYRFSQYTRGDVFHWINSKSVDTENSISCNVGLATSLAAFECKGNSTFQVTVKIPIESEINNFGYNDTAAGLWKQNLSDCTECSTGYRNFDSLFKSALSTLIIHSPSEVYAGPYTYKRFWFRDAAFIIKALLYGGLSSRVEKIIANFFKRQTSDGYFLSQDGEWDSTGQALWVMYQYADILNRKAPNEWMESVHMGCEWISRKRICKPDQPLINGLFPPGFSAEHLGPNDYYYWDNFWGIAGLKAAAEMFNSWGMNERSRSIKNEAEVWLKAVENSLHLAAGASRRPIMPSSPFRRPDSGSVGSLAVGYPLQLWDPLDKRTLLTAEYLFQNCCIENAFYHDISHSGLNPYLTLHIAEVFLRASDLRFKELMEAISSLASSTGQWPEAIHPQLKTGCMGDGQHVWAASEWLIILRNCFIREEESSLIIGQGIYEDLIKNAKKCSITNALTRFGQVNCNFQLDKEKLHIEWKGEWYKEEPSIQIKIPGMAPYSPKKGQREYEVNLGGKSE